MVYLLASLCFVVCAFGWLLFVCLFGAVSSVWVVVLLYCFAGMFIVMNFGVFV